MYFSKLFKVNLTLSNVNLGKNQIDVKHSFWYNHYNTMTVIYIAGQRFLSSMLRFANLFSNLIFRLHRLELISSKAAILPARTACSDFYLNYQTWVDPSLCLCLSQAYNVPVNYLFQPVLSTCSLVLSFQYFIHYHSIFYTAQRTFQAFPRSSLIIS